LRYAVQADCVIGVLSVAQVCPLPGLQPTVAGLINYRGIPLVAFHSTAVLDQARQALAERTLALVVGRHQPEFALLVDEANQVQDIALDTLAVPPGTLAPQARELIVGLSDDGVIVLKADVLFESERLHVQTYLRRQR
jgi:chemotaxis signal transduction protein